MAAPASQHLARQGLFLSLGGRAEVNWSRDRSEMAEAFPGVRIRPASVIGQEQFDLEVNDATLPECDICPSGSPATGRS